MPPTAFAWSAVCTFRTPSSLRLQDRCAQLNAPLVTALHQGNAQQRSLHAQTIRRADPLGSVRCSKIRRLQTPADTTERGSARFVTPHYAWRFFAQKLKLAIQRRARDRKLEKWRHASAAPCKAQEPVPSGTRHAVSDISRPVCDRRRRHRPNHNKIVQKHAQISESGLPLYQRTRSLQFTARSNASSAIPRKIAFRSSAHQVPASRPLPRRLAGVQLFGLFIQEKLKTRLHHFRDAGFPVRQLQREGHWRLIICCRGCRGWNTREPVCGPVIKRRAIIRDRGDENFVEGHGGR